MVQPQTIRIRRKQRLRWTTFQTIAFRPEEPTTNLEAD
jgi:hypothetical protein